MKGGTARRLHGGGNIPYMLCKIRGSRGNLPMTARFSIPARKLHGLMCAPRVCIMSLGVSNGVMGTVLGSVRFRPMASTVLRISFCRVSRTGPVIVRIPIRLRNLTRNMHTNNGLTLRLHGLGIGTLCGMVPRHLIISMASLNLNGAIGINRLDCRNLRLVGTGRTIIYTIGLAHTTHNTTTATNGWSMAFWSLSVGCLVAKLNGVNRRCQGAHRGVKFAMLSTLTGTSGLIFASKHCKTATALSLGKHRLVLLGPSACVGLDKGTIHC